MIDIEDENRLQEIERLLRTYLNLGWGINDYGVMIPNNGVISYRDIEKFLFEAMCGQVVCTKVHANAKLAKNLLNLKKRKKDLEYEIFKG